MREREMSLSEAVADRIMAESQPCRRDDGRKIGLVIEGGCMRGVISAGMVLVFGERILNAFDAVYGVSAGSAVAAYLLAGQSSAISIYYENVNKPEFLDPRRLFSGKPVMDISYLTHKIMKEVKPLQWEFVVDHSIELHVLVTEARQAQTVDFNHFESQDDLLNAIYYSCLMPLIAGRPVVIDAQTAYTDGGVMTGDICLDYALADNCSHVLVLRSRPEGDIPSGDPSIAELIGYLFLKNEYPKLARTILRVYKKRYRQTLLRLETTQTGSQIEAIALSRGSQPVAPFEMDKRKLIRGARDGCKAAAAKLHSFLPNI